MTNPIDLKKIVSWHTAMLDNHKKECAGELFVPITIAQKTVQEALTAQLDAVIEELELDLQKELDNPFFSQTDYILRKIAYYKEAREQLTTNT